MAHPVIGSAFLGIFQDIIGFGSLAKPLGSGFVIRIAVRMVFHRKLAIGGFQFFLASILRHAKNFIVITLAHAVAVGIAGSGAPEA
jgi:hypothetical protein